MASTAIQSQGTKLLVRNHATTPAFVEVGNVVSMSGIAGGSASDIDVTNLQSTAKEYLLGLVDEGEVSISLHYNIEDVGQDELAYLRANAKLGSFKIEIPVGAETVTFAFNASVKQFSKDVGVDSVVSSTVTLKVSGSVTESIA